MRTAWACLLASFLLAPAPNSAPAPAPDSDLGPPTRIEAGGKPLDVFGGHAAPALADVDGDGVRDLLVGQFLGDEKTVFPALMITCRNAGTDGAPKLEAPRFLEGGGERATVPTG